MCVCLLNECFLLFHLALMMDLYALSIFHTCTPSCTRHTGASVCLHKHMCVCLLNECCFFFHLAPTMDLCLSNFSYMHAFVHSSYVSERVLARADVCMFAECMLFLVPSSPDDGFVFFQFFIHACLRALVIRERACAYTSRCVYVFSMNAFSCSI